MYSITKLIESLPAAPHPELSNRYMFIDSRQVIQDMADLGFAVAGIRRPHARTQSGQYRLHEIDFRRPQDVNGFKGEVPRVLFINSYDGSRRAQLISGVFRFACSNGLIVGKALANQKFLHLGDYADELIKQIQESSKLALRVFDRIEALKSIRLDDNTYLEMAKTAADMRFGEQQLSVDPHLLISPRRKEDMTKDLYTVWNVLQENLMKGGLPGVTTDGRVRMTAPVNEIRRSNELNQGLWDLMEDFAELA